MNDPRLLMAAQWEGLSNDILLQASRLSDPTLALRHMEKSATLTNCAKELRELVFIGDGKKE